MEWNTLIHKAAHGSRGLTLENLDDALPEGGEEHIEQTADAHEDALETLELTNDALESITNYTSRLEALIENKTVSLESISLIRMAVDAQLDRIGQEVTYPALEGIAEDDVEGQAKIAVEGFKDFLNNMAQAYVMTFKHIRDALIDSSKFVSVALPRHEKKMLECRRHWNDVKGNLNLDTQVRFAPIGFEYFLTLGNMQQPEGDQLVKAIKEDVLVDRYLLVTYPKSIMSELQSVISAVNGATIKSVEDVMKLGKKIEGYKTPGELLDNKYADKAVMFGANVGVAKGGSKKLVKHVDGTDSQLGRLAEMAGSGAPRMKVGMRSAIYQGMKMATDMMPAVLATSAGGAAALHGAQQVTSSVIHAAVKDTNYFVKAKDIPSFFDAAEGYLDNIRAHLGLERELIRVMDACDGAIEKIEDRLEEAYEAKITGKDASQESFDKAWAESDVALKVIKQIMQFMDALSRSIMRVSAFEQRRAFHAAKSCNYIGLRLIFNAPGKKDVATEGVDDTVATEARTAKDKGSDGKINNAGSSHVGKMVACNFAEGPEVVKVVALHFHEGKATYLAKKPGKGEYLVAQASGESAEHGCFMHCQEVMLGMADESQAKEVFGGKVKAIPAMKKTGETK